jgi:hypothetical protein
MEIWKEISGTNGEYEISNFGRVKSNKKNLVMKHQVNKVNGYCMIVLWILPKPKGKSIHRLVAEHFVDNPLNLKEVNHKDGNKENNHYLNLEWVTRSDNHKHSIKNGLWKYSDSHKEAIAKFNKLTKSKPVIQIDKSGNQVAEYSSTDEAAKAVGASQGNISSCCNGKKGYKTVKGFVFKYKENNKEL